MSVDLPAILRQRDVRTMLDSASLIRESRDGQQRAEQAKQLVFAAMYRFALGQISEAERQRILDVLRPCCPEVFFSPPKSRHREADCWRDSLVPTGNDESEIV
jgi:hypothetical protein